MVSYNILFFLTAFLTVVLKPTHSVKVNLSQRLDVGENDARHKFQILQNSGYLIRFLSHFSVYSLTKIRNTYAFSSASKFSITDHAIYISTMMGGGGNNLVISFHHHPYFLNEETDAQSKEMTVSEQAQN